jgi:hypothetical protein
MEHRIRPPSRARAPNLVILVYLRDHPEVPRNGIG